MLKLDFVDQETMVLMFAILTYIKLSVFHTEEEDLEWDQLECINFISFSFYFFFFFQTKFKLNRKSHLTKFLPGHPVVPIGREASIDPVASAPWSSSLILTIPWAYIKMMGKDLKLATQVALLNANYMRSKLKDHYKILYTDKNGLISFIVFILFFFKLAKCNLEIWY